MSWPDPGLEGQAEREIDGGGVRVLQEDRAFDRGEGQPERVRVLHVRPQPQRGRIGQAHATAEEASAQPQLGRTVARGLEVQRAQVQARAGRASRSPDGQRARPRRRAAARTRIGCGGIVRIASLDSV